nr:RNA polymerase sigma factor [Bacteroidota bacterium]
MTAEEFKSVVLPVRHKLFRLANRLLNCTDDAEDVVQEVFYKLWVKRDDLARYKSIEAFAMVITKNQCLDRIKSKGFRKSELGEWNEPAVDDTPLKRLELNDDMMSIGEIINKLPEQQRIVIHMRDIEGMEFEEIAEILDLNLNAVRVNLSRARKTLRDQLSKKHEYEYRGN